MYPPAMLRGNAAAQKVWRRVMRLYADVEATIVTGLDQDLLIEYCTVVAEVEELNGLRAALADDMDALIKLDARVDRKRAHLHKLRESLYLTPRARAGVAPAAAQAEETPDEMEQLLGEVVQYVNEGKG
jgi:phage terminase small subunit